MAAFLDTNILLYALSSADSDHSDKILIAKQLLRQVSESGLLISSAQVLSEFASVASRKGKPPLSWTRIAEIIEELSAHTVVPIDVSLVQLALARVQTSRISYWDALIVEAALRSGAHTLYTEDMHHGTRYGALELRNPFLA